VDLSGKPVLANVEKVFDHDRNTKPIHLEVKGIKFLCIPLLFYLRVTLW
jgi:hypothetical protein